MSDVSETRIIPEDAAAIVIQQVGDEEGQFDIQLIFPPGISGEDLSTGEAPKTVNVAFSMVSLFMEAQGE